MSAALLIDIAAVGLGGRGRPDRLAARQCRAGVALREGSLEFHQHLAADCAWRDRLRLYRRCHPAGGHHRMAGTEQRLAGVLTAVIAGAATPGGPVVGFSIGAVALKGVGVPPGDRLCRRLGAVCVPAGDFVGNPVHAGEIRLVPLRGLGSVPVFGGRYRNGDRKTVRLSARGTRQRPRNARRRPGKPRGIMLVLSAKRRPDIFFQ